MRVSKNWRLSVTLAGCLLVGACTGSSPDRDDARDDGGPPVLAPGAPGEPNSTLTATPATPDVQQGDLTFLADMVVHHAQAVQMAELVPERAASDDVRRLAERILAGQQPEIDAMSAMISERGGEVPSLEHHEHMDHSAMAGMATPAQLEALEAATGAGFDRQFLTLMIRHHEGALEMVDQLLRGSTDIRIEELATEIGVTQTKEIATMRALLD